MHFKIQFSLLMLILTFPVKGQTDYGLLNYVYLLEAKVYIAPNDSISPEKLMSPNFLENFKEIPDNYLTRANETYWFLIDMSDKTLPQNAKTYLRFPYYDIITLYYERNDSIFTKEAGLRNESAEDILDFSDIPFDSTDYIFNRYLLAKAKDYTNRNRLHDVILHNEFSLRFFDNYQSRSADHREIPYYLFIGGMTLIISFFIGYFFLYRDTLFIVYSIYLLTLLLYLGSKAGFAQDFLRQNLTAYIYYFNNVIQVIVNIFYLLFSVSFLNAKKDFPKLFVFIKYSIFLLVAVVLLMTVLYLINQFSGIEETILNIERYYMILFSLVAYVYILRNYKHRLVVIFISGSFIFLTGAVLAMYFRNVVYMMYGAAIEVFIFSLGLGYKTKQIENEKKRIEGEMNRVRLTALRAQMNPHFLFNSLNSIRAYVISNKVKEASEYLSKFASLIRLILNYSSKEHIELYEEIEAVKLYVKLEELRFRQNFGLRLIPEENIDIHNILIPPLILQPYVENAIRHGLAPAKKENYLEIKISVENNQLTISIRDNGVGRSTSKQLKSLQQHNHKSLAMELTKSRIELMDHNLKINDHVVIIDHYDNTTPTGTEVIIKLPVKQKI